MTLNPTSAPRPPRSHAEPSAFKRRTPLAMQALTIPARPWPIWVPGQGRRTGVFYRFASCGLGFRPSALFSTKCQEANARPKVVIRTSTKSADHDTLSL